MSNHDNHRRGEERRTEHGSRWENGAKWKKLRHRGERRTGKTPLKCNRGSKRIRPVVLPGE